MGLKNKIDRQIYTRQRESLGTTKDITAANISFTPQNTVKMLYRLPYSWIKKSYNFYRRDIERRDYKVVDFFDYYGAINTEILSQINDIGMSGSISSNDNFIFSASIRSSISNYCNIEFNSTKGLYAIIAIYYDGEWHESLYKNITSGNLGIAIPASKDCVLAIILYAPSSITPTSTIYNLGFGFNNKVDYWGVGSLPIETPTWYSGIALQEDENSFTLKNVLKWNAPQNKLSWGGTKVRRTVTESNPHSVYSIPGTNVLNGFYLSSANVSANYPPGKIVVYGGAEYTVLRADSLYGNLITNGGFTSTSGWVTNHTSNGAVKKSTAYAAKDGAYDNDKCIKFEMFATTTGSKTAYIQTTTVVPVGLSPYTFMYHVKSDVATSFVPYWKFFYYTTNSPSTLCSRSSATYYANKVSSAWSQQLIDMANSNTNYGFATDILLPTTCTYIRPRFYGCYGQKPAFKIYLDCVGLYATSKQLIFNASSQPVDAITIGENLTSARNNSTYEIFPLISTTKGVLGRSITRTSNTHFVGPYFTGYNFDGGAAIYESDLANFIKAGDFTCSTKFRYSPGVTFPVYSTALFAGRICYMPESLGKLSVSTTRSLIPDGIPSLLGIGMNISVYAKSDKSGKRFKIITGHTATDNTASKEFEATKDWSRYYFSVIYSLATSNIMAKIEFATANDGNLYLDGFQMTNTQHPVGFLAEDTAAGMLSYSRLSLSAASSDAIFAAPYGCISFSATIDNASDVTDHTCYFMAKRKTTGQTRYLEVKYDYSKKQLQMRNEYNLVGGTISHTCNFGQRQPLNISVLWDTAYFYLGYNGRVKSISKKNIHTSNAILYFGPPTSSFVSNYYLSNLKIDTAKWDNSFVKSEYSASLYSPSQYENSLESQDYVEYDVPRSGQSNPVTFEDSDILPEFTYRYTLQHYDGQFFGKESVATSTYVMPTIPNMPVKTGYHSAESSIEFYWEHSSIGSIPYYYYVYTNTDNNLKNPLKVFKQTGVATSTYVMKGITHSAFITLRVLPVNRWDYYATANAAQIQGRANPVSASRNLLYNSGLDFYFGTNVYDWATANPYKLGRYGDVSNTYYHKYGSFVGGVARGRGVICCDSAAGLPFKFCGFEQTVNLQYGTSVSFTYSHYAHSAYNTQHFASAVYVEWKSGGESINISTYKLRYRESEVGDDGRTWRRYSTTFSMDKTASVNSVVIRPRMSTASVAYYVWRRGYVDSPQLELGNTMTTWEWTKNREYVEPPFNPGGGVVFTG